MVRRVSIVVSVLITVACLPSFAQQSLNSADETLTLADAVRIAQENNRTVRNALIASSIAEDKIAEARTYRLPSLDFYAYGSQLLTPVDFTFKAGTFGTFPGIGPVPANDTNIHTPLRPTFYGVQRLSQPLSQQYKIGLNIKLANVNKLYNDQKLRLQKQDIANKVKHAYYAIVRTQSSLELNNSMIELDREMDRVLQDQLTQQVALKADSMDIKARLASDQYNILSLRNSLESQKEQLNELLGRDLQTPFSVSSVSEIPTVEVSLRQARERALASRSELRQGRLGIQQAELNWQIKKSEYIPDVSFVATDMSTVNVNLLPSNIASVGVLLTWTPLDWGRRKHELAEDAKAIAQSKNSLSEAQDQILVDVGDKFRKL